MARMMDSIILDNFSPYTFTKITTTHRTSGRSSLNQKKTVGSGGDVSNRTTDQNQNQQQQQAQQHVLQHQQNILNNNQHNTQHHSQHQSQQHFHHQQHQSFNGIGSGGVGVGGGGGIRLNVQKTHHRIPTQGEYREYCLFFLLLFFDFSDILITTFEGFNDRLNIGYFKSMRRNNWTLHAG